MTKLLVDLHLHSNYSDGKLSPKQIVKKLAGAGVSFAALTDHDCVDGVSEFRREAKKAGIETTAGVEISAVLDGVGIHILGYGIDTKNSQLINLFKKQGLERKKAFERYVALFKKAGFAIDKKKHQEFKKIKSPAKTHIFRLIWEVPKNQELCRKKYGFQENERIQSKFVNTFMTLPGQLAYVKKKSISAKDAMDLIRKAGGIAVWAHPGLEMEFNDKTLFPRVFKSLLSYGLKGLEAFSTAHTHTKSRTKYLYNLARKNRLMATIGTDDHDGLRIGILKVSSKYHKEILKNKTRFWRD